MKRKGAKKKNQEVVFFPSFAFLSPLFSQFLSFSFVSFFFLFFSRYADRLCVSTSSLFFSHAASRAASTDDAAISKVDAVGARKRATFSLLLLLLLRSPIASFRSAADAFSIATRERETEKKKKQYDSHSLLLSTPRSLSGRSSLVNVVPNRRAGAHAHEVGALRNRGRKKKTFYRTQLCRRRFLDRFDSSSSSSFTLTPFSFLSLSSFTLSHTSPDSSLFTMAALPEVKLFGKWSYEDVEVRE